MTARIFLGTLHSRFRAPLAAMIPHDSHFMVAQGNYAEAEPLYERSLAIFEKALGPQHPNVAQSLNSLAELLKAQVRIAIYPGEYFSWSTLGQTFL